MNGAKRLKFIKGDIIAILIVVAMIAATFLFFAQTGEKEAGNVLIFQNGSLIYDLPLEKDAVLVIGGEYENTIEIHDNTVSITHSTCPGEDCVHTGKISSAGRSIVCLPNRVEIRLTNASDVDFSVR